MAEPFNVHFEITGPVFDGSGLRVMQGIVNRGLLDIALLEGANKVKDQLYGPPASQYWKSDKSQRHGAHTRDLKRRVGVKLIRDNLAVFDAGKYSHGQSIHYAEKVEGLYHMFEKAAEKIERNKGALLDKHIGDALVEAFQ
jgi:hypothetical protein